MRPKIQKFVFDELADNFEVVSEQEQAMYFGGNRIYLNANGSPLTIVSSFSTTETLILNGNEIELPFGTWLNSQRGDGTCKFAATAMFAFKAQYSGVEWGMAIQSGEKARVFSCFNDEQVGMLGRPNTLAWVHSHPSWDDVSEEDMSMAGAYPDYAHFVWYNGQFRQFYEFGWMGDWRPNLFLW